MNKKLLQEGVLRSFGPGILFAAASVGTSHLVQSTRAGAMYGTALAVFIIIAMAVKYPAFRFAPQYTAATGATMLEGFARQGSWILVLFCFITLGTVFTGGAAITMVSAGIIKGGFNLHADASVIAAGVLIFTAALLIIGHYHWLELLMKPLMLVLAAATIMATVLTLPLINWSHSAHLFPAKFDMRTLLFTAALIGWMPSPLEVAILHTMWSKAKAKDIGHKLSSRHSSIDFHFGYIVTLMLALCFLLLGTGLMYGSGIEFQNSAGGFATQLIDLYARALGAWTRPVMVIVALSVMYSTVIAHVDGFSRIFEEITRYFMKTDAAKYGNNIYHLFIVVITSGILCVIFFFMTSFKLLIDIATTISFLAAPLLAILIHYVITRPDVPAEARPSGLLRNYSILCNIILSLFALGYLYIIYR